MAVGENGRAVQSTVTGHGPQAAADRVGKHVRGSGRMPGTGASAGPSDQANAPASRGDSDNDGM